MSKTALFSAAAGATVVAGVSSNTVTVTDWDSPVVIGAEFANLGDSLKVYHLKTDALTWEILAIDQEPGDGAVVLSPKSTRYKLTVPGTYALGGTLVGAAVGYKIVSASYGESTLTTTAANAFAIGEVGFLAAAGTVTLADADAEATTDGILYMATAIIAAGAAGVFSRGGNVTVTGHGFTIGAPLYVSATAGGLTETPPGAGDFVRVAGYALDTNTIFFNPSGVVTAGV